jgi:hypothetical protein
LVPPLLFLDGADLGAGAADDLALVINLVGLGAVGAVGDLVGDVEGGALL